MDLHRLRVPIRILPILAVLIALAPPQRAEVLGSCVPGAGTVQCDDAIACTIDSCSEDGHCVHAPDDLACGPQEHCVVHRCTESGCTHTNIGEGAQCNDGNMCTLGDRCFGGGCGFLFFSPPGGACSDGNSCTTDVCNGGGQCLSTQRGAPGEVTVVFGMYESDDALAWEPSPRTDTGVEYDVAVGSVAELPVGSDASESCQSIGNSTFVVVPDLPDFGASTWYLVRVRDNCGVGSYGYSRVQGQAPVERVPVCP